jgi:hypothetical protein
MGPFKLQKVFPFVSTQALQPLEMVDWTVLSSINASSTSLEAIIWARTYPWSETFPSLPDTSKSEAACQTS